MKLTFEEIYIKNEKVYNDKFIFLDLENEYKNSKSRLTIYCNDCGRISRKPLRQHLSHNCLGCKKILEKNTLNFILEKSKFIHDDRFTYLDIENEFEDMFSKITIYCNDCGYIFRQTVDNHINKKCRCPKCVGRNNKLSITEILEKSKEKHNGKLILINIKKEYYPIKSDVLVECKECDYIFTQRLSAHLNGHGCSNCVNLKKKIPINILLERFKKIHGDKFIYLDSFEKKYKDGKSKIDIFCNSCKKIFFQRICTHLEGHSCPFCKESKGEKLIAKFLEKHLIQYSRQHKFDNCKNKQKLPFDFYLSDFKICIEFDGEQHFKPIEYFGGEKCLKDTQRNDQIKNEFCKNSDIKLIRIKYSENINEKFKELKELLINQKNNPQTNGELCL